MSIVTAAALALLLAVDPPAAPPAPEPAAPSPPPAALAAPLPATTAPPAALGVTATVAPAAPATTSTSTRQVRAGLGVSVTDADSGYASTMQAGVQVDPWNLFGFRAGLGMTTSVFGAGGWDAAELTGSVLFRPIGSRHRVVPYLGAGIQLALLAVFPDTTTPPPAAARVAPGHLSPTLAAAVSEATVPSMGFGGTSQFKVMPEVTAGALVGLTPQLNLDLTARYLPITWEGTTYSGFSFIVSFCAPF